MFPILRLIVYEIVHFYMSTNAALATQLLAGFFHKAHLAWILALG